MVGGQGDAHGSNRSIGYGRRSAQQLDQAVHDPRHRSRRPLQLADHLRAADVVAERVRASQCGSAACPSSSTGSLGAITALLLFASVLSTSWRTHSWPWRAACRRARSRCSSSAASRTSAANRSPPTTEFVVAIVGPLTSFALAAIGMGGGDVRRRAARRGRGELPVLHQPEPGHLQSHPGLSARRRPRAALDPVGRDCTSLRRATDWAANVGKVVAVLMVARRVACCFQRRHHQRRLARRDRLVPVHAAASSMQQQLARDAPGPRQRARRRPAGRDHRPAGHQRRGACRARTCCRTTCVPCR